VEGVEDLLKSSLMPNSSTVVVTTKTSEGDQKPIKTFSWEEISKHKQYNDCWTVINGKVYDVTSWVPKHPGGMLILNGAGRDSTPLFLSYHPLKVKQMLHKYEIGEVDIYKTYYDYDSEFYTVLKRRVEEHLQNKDLGGESLLMFMKTALVIIGWAISYYFAMIQGWLVAAIFLGFFHSHIGISIGHDATHGAYSKRSAVSEFFAKAFDVMGASTIVWQHQHNIGHHPHSNIDEDEEYDPDSKSGAPMVRLSPNQPWRPYHRFQHLYIWPLIAGMSSKWFINDVRSLVRRRYMTIDFFEVLSSDIASVAFWKSSFFVYGIMIPSLYHPWWRTMALVLCLLAVTSYYTVLMFAVNHLTDVSEFPNKTWETRDWAKLQVLTSTNFANDSTLWTWLSGGLNFQIEHHLFPSICHVYLPEIAPIVKKTCEEFNVHYVIFPSYFDALRGHYKHLKQLGQGPEKIKSK